MQKFDDWYYHCIDDQAADRAVTTHCEVAQIATVKRGNRDANILTLAIAKLDHGNKCIWLELGRRLEPANISTASMLSLAGLPFSALGRGSSAVG
ncbi:hypothetical protein BN77_p11571 [Rhizobium mesoamericanum STM3625]|uniref:Uncharacterized protein n=1 Tax=Rhizobium mesoamericanum STM3625 TaxID=1211777 RepID=K0PQG0_9HYPH|nr:hypothetical protein BN77_p11571 [Rhizobium mesoamericanum STM3625]